MNSVREGCIQLRAIIIQLSGDYLGGGHNIFPTLMNHLLHRSEMSRLFRVFVDNICDLTDCYECQR
jgi:hypothetical protein